MKIFRAAASIFCVLGTVVVSSTASASLIGDTISASGLMLNPTSATIGAGVEFVGLGGYPLDFDFGANTLTISSKGGLNNWWGYGPYTYSGFDDTITSFSLVSNTGFVANFLDDFSFTSNSITLNMNLGSVTNVEQGDVAVFSINSIAAVPEPSSLVLMGLALAVIGARVAGRSPDR